MTLKRIIYNMCGRYTVWMLLAAAISFAPAGALAATYDWTNVNGGVFSDAGNWAPAGPPGGIDTAGFAASAAYTVIFTGNTVNTNLSVLDGSVTFDMAGFTYTLSTDPAPLLVQGSGAQAPILIVSNGVLNDVDAAGSQRRIIIAGDANTRGTLYLVNGGRALFNRGTFGNGDTGEANITVDGSGSQLQAASYVQINGDTSITITNGGYMYHLGAEICGSAGSQLYMLITGSGSQFSCNNLFIGRRGTAIVRVEDGGILSGWEPFISSTHDDAVGEVTVNGAGSTFIWTAYLDRRLHIGQLGSGTLILEDGAVAYGNAGQGTAATVYPNGVLRGPDGTVRTLSGDSGAGEVLNQGLVAPGGTNRTGTLTIEGHYKQASTATLRIRIEGTDSGSYDRLIVQGNNAGHCDVTLNGTLEIVFPDGILYGGDFDVLTTEGAITGEENLSVTFDATELPDGLPSSYSWELAVVNEEGLNKLRLTIIPPPKGTVVLLK